MLKNIH